MVNAPRLLTADELASELQISPRTLARLVGKGLPRIRVHKRLYRYDIAAVLKWCQAQNAQDGRVLH